jgi:hypothetical protein
MSDSDDMYGMTLLLDALKARHTLSVIVFVWRLLNP